MSHSQIIKNIFETKTAKNKMNLQGRIQDALGVCLNKDQNIMREGHRETTLCFRRCVKQSTPNASKTLKFGKISGSADTKDFINVSGKSALSDCLDTNWTIWIPRYLTTSELAGRHAIIQIALGEPSISSLTIKDAIRLSKILTGQQLSVEKRFSNCWSKVSIKGMPIDLL